MKSIIKLINFTDISLEEKKMVLSWRNHQDIRRWMNNRKEITLEEHLNYINSLCYKKDRIYFLVKESNDYLGVINFTNIVKNKYAEFGIYAVPYLAGVGSKLMDATIDYAFDILKLKRLIANVYINNEKAIKLYKKFDFKEIQLDADSNGKLLLMEFKDANMFYKEKRIKNEVIKSEYGYYIVKDIPTHKELEKYYSEYSTQDYYKYSDNELINFEYASKVAQFIFKNLYNNENNSFLDVGAGTGFFASSFFNNNWNVTTIDHSNYGINKHNAHLLDTLILGNIFNTLEDLSEQENNKFDFINLSNILEHVIEPIKLLKILKLLLSDKSLLRISVPNDFSKFQQFLLDKKYTTNTWVCPEHFHYFTLESLSNLLLSLGYEIVVSMGEFPIELYLSNESSNYKKNKEAGKFAHKSRIEVDNFLFEQGIEKYINYYKASADIGLSRQIVVFCKVK